MQTRGWTHCNPVGSRPPYNIKRQGTEREDGDGPHTIERMREIHISEMGYRSLVLARKLRPDACAQNPHSDAAHTRPIHHSHDGCRAAATPTN